MNPSLEETIINGRKDYKDCVFDDDRFITTFCCYKHMDKISLNKRILNGRKTCYSYPKLKKKNTLLYPYSNATRKKYCYVIFKTK